MWFSRSWPAIVLLVLGAALPGHSGSPADKNPPATEFTYDRVIPLGGDVLQLEPMHRRLVLFGAVESAGLHGLKRVESGDRHWVVTPNGSRVRHFPDFVQFRITASARDDSVADETRPFRQHASTDLNQYLLALRFRAVVFRGLHEREIEPRSVRMIGVPADQPSDERIYLVGISLPELPATDRLVLEVLDADGNRLTKFHLDF